jgi:hypothetical protein
MDAGSFSDFFEMLFDFWSIEAEKRQGSGPGVFQAAPHDSCLRHEYKQPK